MKKLLTALNQVMDALNAKGIMVPTVRDPRTGKGSVTFTMVCVSFGLMLICTLLTIAMVLNKWSGMFKLVDSNLDTLKEAFSMALQMTGLSSGLYWSRKWQDNGNNLGENLIDTSHKTEHIDNQINVIQPDNPDSNL